MRKNTLHQISRIAPKLSILKAGDLVDGTLIDRAPKAAYFDLGSFGTGVVFGSEFSNAGKLIKNLSDGDRITAKVIDIENDDGYVELSLTEASTQKVWESVRELMDRGEILPVQIVGANSGGLLAEVNDMRAFLPVSQLTADHYPRVDDGDRAKILGELKKLVGTELNVKIIDVKPKVGKIILSERETVQENIKEFLTQYAVGDVVDGIISGVADFGAFVRFADNPQIEGLIHISELDHRLIESPKEVVKIGDAVKVKIIEIREGKVSLSLKALKSDPWANVGERYRVGDEIDGVVARFNPFGAFVALDTEIQGLIHVSEFGSVEEMRKQLELGKTYRFMIELVNGAEKRIILKLKRT
jgi:small subunit ribosomal protein S1